MNKTSQAYEKGKSLWNTVNPGTPARLEALFADICPEFAEMAIALGYGTFMSDQTLDVKTRELLFISGLTVSGTAPAQLRVHVQNALNLGSTQAEITATLFQCVSVIGFPAVFNALLIAKEVFHNRNEGQ